MFYYFIQVDNASSYQRKLFGFALSIILTLRLPQVLDKLDQILRCEINVEFLYFLELSSYTVVRDLFNSCSVCTSVILGGNDDLTEEESRLHLL